MKRSRKIAIALVGVVAAVGIGTGIAVATGGDDDGTDTPITGPALDRATNAALDYIGGGRVTGTEVGDEESYYEVEVTRDDGSQIDVQLDRDFQVVASEADGTTDDEGGADS